MSQPPGKCRFCGEPGLTKGHIWPESFGRILPSDANYHEQKIGSFESFSAAIPGPEKWERVGTGPLQKRRPRNTCHSCNTGWMSRLEQTTGPMVRPMILGEQMLLTPIEICLLASMYALISMRIELTAHGMRTIPQSEIDFLRLRMLPSENWRIWIARHAGDDLKDYKYRYTAMQIESDPSVRFGKEFCNTQVTTLVVGKLFVHIMFSTAWPEFGRYEGVSLTPLWPHSCPYIDTRWLPPISDVEGVFLHEAISRAGNSGRL